MIRKNTWLLLIVLAGLIGLTFYLNNRKALSEFEATPAAEETRFLFTAEEGLPSRIRVEAATGEVTELTHNAGTAWALIQPEGVAADQGLAEAAASQISTLRVLDEVSLDLDIVGLDQPAYVIKIAFTGGKNHTLEVGSVTPSQSGYYVHVDDGGIVIVSKTSLDALVNLVTFPPYAETPTPSPAPITNTPVPDPESTPTAAP
jgi:hypothetical protein